MHVEQIAELLEELIEAVRVQNKELERQIYQLNQVTPQRDVSPEFSVVSSELVSLKKRLQKLRSQQES